MTTCGVLSNVFHLPCERPAGHAEPDHCVTTPAGSVHQWVDYDVLVFRNDTVLTPEELAELRELWTRELATGKLPIIGGRK